MPKRKAKDSQGLFPPDSPWKDVKDAANNPQVLATLKEVQEFWTHGDIDAKQQVQGAKTRTRGTQRSKSNTDYQLDIKVGEVVYRATIRGGGDASIRCPDTGRVWITQPCVICHRDDNEETLLLCGTDDETAAFSGCSRSHHTACVGLEVVPEEDWFCPSCKERECAPTEEKSNMTKKSKRKKIKISQDGNKPPNSLWKDVKNAANNPKVLATLKEVQEFWTHGDIDAKQQVQGAKTRTRGTQRSKSNTDYQLDIKVGEVVYRATIRGGGDASIRCPDTGRVWITQPCVICHRDDNEETLLLCGTDDETAAFSGCSRSHHTACVGLEVVPEEDWFCPSCKERECAPTE